VPALAGARGLDQVAGVATRSFRLFLAQGELLSDIEGGSLWQVKHTITTVARTMFARMVMVHVARFAAQWRAGLKEACDADSSAYGI
jgi:hypothetical protein